MDLLLILTYAAICYAIFKLFKIPVNAYTLLTAALGGVFLLGFLLLAMNYNHPFTKEARFFYFTTPIVPTVRGRVVEVAPSPAIISKRATFSSGSKTLPIGMLSIKPERNLPMRSRPRFS
jgi:energy-coupling factor transporter transmembrane protein EcfT